MLDSFEISRELVALGFRLTVDNAHAAGSQHPALDTLVFLKRGNGAPVGKQPIVIHPGYEEAPSWGDINAMTPTPPNHAYRNTNLTGFPRVPGSQSRRGIALDVRDIPNLHKLLNVLGYATAQESRDVTTLADSVFAGAELTDTEHEALIKARIGQGDYRNDLLAYWGGCAVTSCSVPQLLRASHIKPWRLASAAERLDPFNGLLLTPNLDLAFDHGLISFNDQGQILLSEDLDPDSACALNITPNLRLRQIEPRHRLYLAWHRDYLFRK